MDETLIALVWKAAVHREKYILRKNAAENNFTLMQPEATHTKNYLLLNN